MLIFKKIFHRNLLWVLMGIIVFSPFSSNITLDILHLPMSFPELLSFPFCIFLWSNIKRVKINKHSFALLMGLMLLLIVFAVLIGTYSLFAILGAARAYFWIFLFYCVFKSNSNPFSLNDLAFISLGSIAGWFISSLFSLRTLLQSLVEYEAVYGAMLSMPIFLSFCYIKKKYNLLVIGLILIVLVIVTSGIRRLIAVVLLSLLVMSLLSIIAKPKRIIKISSMLGVLIIGLFLSLPLLKETMKETSHSLYHRVFERSETYLQGDVDDSDTGRLQDIFDLFETSYLYIVPPRGFVSRQTATDKGAGDFNDLPLKELFWTFSLPGALFIIFYYYRRTMIHYRRFIKTQNEESFVIITYMVVMFALLFMEGTFLAYPYATPITGACLGLADKKTF